jgi:hypothetical protein
MAGLARDGWLGKGTGGVWRGMFWLGRGRVGWDRGDGTASAWRTRSAGGAIMLNAALQARAASPAALCIAYVHSTTGLRVGGDIDVLRTTAAARNLPKPHQTVTLIPSLPPFRPTTTARPPDHDHDSDNDHDDPTRPRTAPQRPRYTKTRRSATPDG